MLQMATAPAVDVAMAMAVTMVVNIRKETVKRPKFQVALRRRSIVELTWPRVVQNGAEWTREQLNFAKVAQGGPDWPRIAQCGPEWPRLG